MAAQADHPVQARQLVGPHRPSDDRRLLRQELDLIGLIRDLLVHGILASLVADVQGFYFQRRFFYG